MGEQYASDVGRSATGPAAAESGPETAKSISADFSINARVMQLLARRWVVMSSVEVGTTDGVVLIQGRMEREPKGWGENDELARERFLTSLRSTIRRIPGVVDVVMSTLEADDREAPWA